MTSGANALNSRIAIDSTLSEYLIRSVLLIALIFYTGGLGAAINGDLDAEALPGAPPKGSGAMQVILTSLGLFAILVTLLSREATILLLRSWPVYMLAALCLASVLWSANRWLTVRRAISLILTLLVGTAIGGRMRSDDAIGFTLRGMSFICLLSIAWVVGFPREGMHNDTDAMQSVHAGLWRGIFGHKVTLGYFSGLTLGMLLFYRGLVFRSRVMFVVAVLASTACILGSNSGNGYAMAIFMPLILYGTWLVTLVQPRLRRILLVAYAVAAATFALMLYGGSLDYFARFFGKSVDLTGRTIFWPVIIAYVDEHAPYRGFGYAAGMTAHVGPQIQDTIGFYIGEAHNGYLEAVVSFGYVGASFVFATFIWLFFRAEGIIAHTTPTRAKVAIFPLAIISALLLTSYNEAVMLTHVNIWTVLLAISVAILMRESALQSQGVAVETAGG